MDNILDLEEIVKQFCEKNNMNFFDFGITPTMIVLFNTNKSLGNHFLNFLIKNGLDMEYIIEGDTQVYKQKIELL